MQYDLYLNDTHVGGISAIGLAEQAWVVGHRFRYPHLGAKEEFIVSELIREGGRFRANVLIVETNEEEGNV